MSVYTILYVTHVLAVCLSGSFFVLRGFWMLAENPLLCVAMGAGMFLENLKDMGRRFYNVRY